MSKFVGTYPDGTIESGNEKLTGIDDAGKTKNYTINDVASKSTYTNATPTPVDVGGIEAGSTFTAQTIVQMFNELLYPYEEPSFTSFSISGSSTFECGNTLTADQTATWSTSHSANVSPDTVDIYDVTQTSELVTDTANDGSEVLEQSAITHNVPTSHTWRIDADNTETSNFVANHTKNWYWARYYGESANASNLTENEIEALRVKDLTNSFTTIFDYLSGPTYKFIAYPSSFGTATSFRDTSTNNQVAMNPLYVVSVTNIFGQTTNYNIHRTTNVLNGAISIAIS